MTPPDYKQRAAGERYDEHSAQIIAMSAHIDWSQPAQDVAESSSQPMSKDDAVAMLSECRQTLHKDKAL